MASRKEKVLSSSERKKLLNELGVESVEEITSEKPIGSNVKVENIAVVRKRKVVSCDNSISSGCRVCGKDNDHSKVLLCDGCNSEYHCYCVGLADIPRDDWFCGESLCSRCCFSVAFSTSKAS
jgi:hypothetical protein